MGGDGTGDATGSGWYSGCGGKWYPTGTDGGGG
jgi:hypothetical protein